MLHVTWVGAPPSLPKREFLDSAEGDREQALDALFDLLSDAPLLGSLLERTGGDRFETLRMREVARLPLPLRERARRVEPNQKECVVAARGRRRCVAYTHLRIMETTDLHVHVYPYDYYSDKVRDTVGLARTAAHISDIRAEATNTMLVDNGDFLQGNPMGDYIAYERGMKEGDMHPVITAMNTLGFDGSTLGNHEFNYGLDFLMKSLAGAKFPIVSANIAKSMGSDPTSDETLIPPYVILDRMLIDGDGTEHAIKVGLIGFVPPQIMNWDRRHLEGNVNTRDIVDTARAYVPQMKEAGADIIIALSHSGIGAADHSDGMENASVPLAQIDGIDALVTGHSHLVFPSATYDEYAGVDVASGTIHGKPATMGGFWGSHLGVIDLMLENDAGEWRVVTTSTEVRPISKRNQDRSTSALVESDAAVLASIAAEHEATLKYIRRGAGERCPGQGLAGTLGRHVQSDRSGAARSGAAERRVPQLQL